MILAHKYTEIPEQEYRALLHCAQFLIEQRTGKAVYRDEPIPAPSAGVLGLALRALQAAKREAR